jgi:multidrug efflux pump subunit AcrA (membrane-fusion protein)
MPFVLRHRVRRRAWALAALLGLTLLAGGAGAGEAVVARALQRVSVTGYTRAATTLDLAAEVSGKVLQVHYEVGDAVGARPVCEIDPTFVDFEIQRLQQALQQTEIALERTRSRAAYLEKEYRRVENLFLRDSTAASRRDAAQEDFQQASLEVRGMAADIAAQRTRLAELRERRRRHRLAGPQGYVVVAKHVEAGEWVAAGSPVARLGDFRTLVVPLAVTAAELEALRRLPAEFPVRLEGRPAVARLHWVNPEFDEASRKRTIEIAVGPHDGEPRGGLAFELALEVPGQGLEVPRAAVDDRYAQPKVRLHAGGEAIPVMVLGESADRIVIAEDPRLPPGTVLLTP